MLSNKYYNYRLLIKILLKKKGYNVRQIVNRVMLVIKQQIRV